MPACLWSRWDGAEILAMSLIATPAEAVGSLVSAKHAALMGPTPKTAKRIDLARFLGGL